MSRFSPKFCKFFFHNVDIILRFQSLVFLPTCVAWCGVLYCASTQATKENTQFVSQIYTFIACSCSSSSSRFCWHCFCSYPAHLLFRPISVLFSICDFHKSLLYKIALFSFCNTIDKRLYADHYESTNNVIHWNFIFLQLENKRKTHTHTDTDTLKLNGSNWPKWLINILEIREILKWFIGWYRTVIFISYILFVCLVQFSRGYTF